MYAVFVRHLFALFFPFLLGVYLIPIIIRAAKKVGFVDSPDGRLKFQKEPVAYLGGVAIFIPFIATLGLCYPFENQMLWLLMGTTLLLFVGLIDDFSVLKPRQKFFAQFLAVLCFMKGGFSLKTTFFSSYSNIFWSAFWALAIINAFNLVDVMDGLCATLALVGAGTFCFIAVYLGKYTVSLLLTVFIGSVAAFWIYNKPQAKIYLGDAGSLFIGGFLAAVPFLFDWEGSLFSFSMLGGSEFVQQFIRPLVDVFFIPTLVLGIPLLECASLFVIRSWLSIPFYQGSPHHFSIYLQNKGWTKQRVLLFVFGSSMFLSALVLLLIYEVIPLSWLLGILIAFLLWWVSLIFSGKQKSVATSKGCVFNPEMGCGFFCKKR